MASDVKMGKSKDLEKPGIPRPTPASGSGDFSSKEMEKTGEKPAQSVPISEAAGGSGIHARVYDRKRDHGHSSRADKADKHQQNPKKPRLMAVIGSSKDSGSTVSELQGVFRDSLREMMEQQMTMFASLQQQQLQHVQQMTSRGLVPGGHFRDRVASPPPAQRLSMRGMKTRMARSYLLWSQIPLLVMFPPGKDRGGDAGSTTRARKVNMRSMTANLTSMRTLPGSQIRM